VGLIGHLSTHSFSLRSFAPPHKEKETKKKQNRKKDMFNLKYMTVVDMKRKKTNDRHERKRRK